MFPETSSPAAVRSRLTALLSLLVLVTAITGVGIASPTTGQTASAAVAETTRATDEPIGSGNYTLSGRILLSNGDPAVNHTVLVTDRTIEQRDIDDEIAVRTNGSGYFTVGNLTAGHTYTVAYYSSSRRDIAAEFPTDGSPDMYAYGNVTLANDTSLGTIALPEASTITVRVRNETQPVKGVYVRYAHHNNGTVTYWADLTAASGYVHDGAGEKAFELTGNVSILVQSPGQRYVNETYYRNFTVTGDRNVTVTLEQRSDWTPTETDARSTPADGESRTGTPTKAGGTPGKNGDAPGGGPATKGIVALVVVLAVLFGSFALLRD